MNSERLDRCCERGIVGLVLAVLVFGPLALGAVRGPHFIIIQWLVSAAALLWVVRLWVNPQRPLVWPPLAWAVVAFTAYALARYWFADIEYVARLEVVKIVVYALLFLIVVNNFEREEWMRLVALTLIGVATFVAAYAVYQYFTESRSIWGIYERHPTYWRRGSGTYLVPNHSAGLLEMVWPLALAYVLRGRLGASAKVLLGYALLVILVGIAVSLSRGGWLATTASMVFLLVLLLRQKNFRVLGALAGVLILGIGVWFIFFSDTARTRWLSMLPNGEQVDDIRLRYWQAAWQIWQDNFWWGAGPAHYYHRFPAYRAWDAQPASIRVCNDYLNTLCDFGLVGGLFVLSALTLFTVGMWRGWKRYFPEQEGLSPQSNRAALLLGGITGLMAIAVHSFLDFNLHIPANAAVTTVLMALLTLLACSSGGPPTRTSTLVKLFISLAVLVAMVGVVLQGTRQWREEQFLAKGKAALRFGLEYQTAYKAAFAIEPRNPRSAYEVAESYRRQSLLGTRFDDLLIAQSVEWYDKARQLDRYDPFTVANYGHGLERLGRRAEAAEQFKLLEKLDPEGGYALAMRGWFRVQLDDYAGALPLLERSVHNSHQVNPVGFSYYEIVKQRLRERQLSN
jgi:O-antigen ligase